MRTTGPETIIASHAKPGESVRTAFTAYVNAGLRRRVIGATDRRLIVVRSGYFSLSDKGLLWADPIDQVALYGSYTVWRNSGLNTGNAYVRIRRADGSTVTFNPRDSFIGQTGSAEANIKKLFALISGRV
ncbi:hypothetical protein [Nonomuraea guangzhouensis]|uniref:YokE-like PH domain-containing protein n=1 Tax=Nonomuraea guangzhouensis TaxID=1291555 RepID=A0ABW4GKA3_9ACTN|nr:hypothetical protein [Nonomuraea guangzhouensis]